MIGRGTLLLMAALLPLSLQAAERVTLLTGFVVNCNHHAQVDGHMRLYLSTGEDNYIQIAPDEIANVEIVPDSPAATDIANGASTVPSSAISDKKLSQADLNEMLARAGREHNLDVDLLATL